ALPIFRRGHNGRPATGRGGGKGGRTEPVSEDPRGGDPENFWHVNLHDTFRFTFPALCYTQPRFASSPPHVPTVARSSVQPVTSIGRHHLAIHEQGRWVVVRPQIGRASGRERV